VTFQLKSSYIKLWKVSEINTGNLRNEATMTKNLSTKRKGGKAAYVSADILSYGFCRMLDAFFNLAKAPFEVKVFRSVEESKTWLVA